MKKAYPAYFDTYDEMDKLRAYLDGQPLLVVAYNNMDHSMVTAFEPCATSRHDKSNLCVNTEQSYQKPRKQSR